MKEQKLLVLAGIIATLFSGYIYLAQGADPEPDPLLFEYRFTYKYSVWDSLHDERDDFTWSICAWNEIDAYNGFEQFIREQRSKPTHVFLQYVVDWEQQPTIERCK